MCWIYIYQIGECIPFVSHFIPQKKNQFTDWSNLGISYHFRSKSNIWSIQSKNSVSEVVVMCPYEHLILKSEVLMESRELTSH